MGKEGVARYGQSKAAVYRFRCGGSKATHVPSGVYTGDAGPKALNVATVGTFFESFLFGANLK